MKKKILFCSVGKDLAEKIDLVHNPSLADNLNAVKSHFRTTDVQEITNAFAIVKTMKSFGTDNICSYFLKLTLPFTENSLAFLFNRSIETSRFPYSRKNA